ncbi:MULTISPECIES: UDP-N-acetylmuramate dehydrogenase [unclassified Methylophaga]|uniref:UDP-N-acetylmuramate dehydrogenase n=1 Tax=unclassified Methylophaga TaxID=2629249 RepID=UPI000C9044A3|nr:MULTISPECIES: UDP-N-acetylmuramate dehydrogenase [unclassified Methylophaga]MBN47196.1 UDP-N-acetylenolpyruvoylglucosamine reductase [Methylophaga sp.]|tara:strand:- start:13920 stop:14810 length:891 start_codon:yes stop_codon:yes gene_type:complete
MVSMFTALQGELKTNEPLSQHTSWRVGGIAQRFYQPKDKHDLATFLRQLPANEPLLWLGLGSNLLIRDGGFAGTVISTAGTMQALEFDGQTVTAEVGVYCSKVARQSAKHGLSGAAFLAGIPGTFGGALAMNAGAHGSETWQLVTEATTVTRQGELKKRPASDFKVSYRHVELPEKEWFVSATLDLQRGDTVSETALIRQLLKKRNDSQPTNQPCAGSVFRNPQGDFAGRLIEHCGLKGVRVGGASVSSKHANFIVNDGSASAADIEALINLVRQRVEAETKVNLVPEVHIIGEHA